VRIGRIITEADELRGIALRSRSPASPWSAVIACSGIVTSSRRSPGPMLPSVADVTPSQPPHAKADPRARVLTALPGVGQFTALVVVGAGSGDAVSSENAHR
jgi:hypothetical protein